MIPGMVQLQGTRPISAQSRWGSSVLVELSISNFAIIDRLTLRFGPGFNALTGETGAGKSIIIDAVSALLGAKLGAEFVRHGFPTARVEGLFDTTRLAAPARRQ